MAIFAVRISRERKELSQVEILGKFAGAVGNYNAHIVASPDVNWPCIAEEFLQSLGLSFNPCVVQAPKSLFTLGEMLDEYISLKEQNVVLDQEKVIVEQEKNRVQILLQGMQNVMTTYNASGNLPPHAAESAVAVVSQPAISNKSDTEEKQRSVDVETICELLIVVMSSEFPSQVNLLIEYLKIRIDYCIL